MRQTVGFRKGCRSCQTSLTRLIDKCILAIDSGNIVGFITTCLRKAFDLLNIDILLKTLCLYGCSHNAVVWSSSYLTGRREQVVLHGNYSEAKCVQYGVPQGSTLGSLMFLIYIYIRLIVILNCMLTTHLWLA